MIRTIFLLGLFFAPLGLHAHEIKYVDGLEILLHIEPQDSPIVKEKATLYFAFTDPLGEFDVHSCDCSLIVKSQGREIYTTNLNRLEPNFGSTVISTDYVFLEKGVYEATIFGERGRLDRFQITFNIRIEREIRAQSDSALGGIDGALLHKSEYVLHGLFLLTALSMIYFGYRIK